MTELGWITTNDPILMLEFLRDKASLRKLRLFACACVRLVGPLLAEELSRRAYKVLERFVEGQATRNELTSAHAAAWHAYRALWSRSSSDNPRSATGQVARLKISQAANTVAHATRPADTLAEVWDVARYTIGTTILLEGGRSVQAENDQIRRNQCELLRDLFGNPFKPAFLDPGWLQERGEQAVQVAGGIYDDRSFEELPILADVLIEAECPCAELIEHCQKPGEHGRGCWAVDLIVGRN